MQRIMNLKDGHQLQRQMVLNKKDTQTSIFGIDCWSIQPDGLNSVLTEINARLDTVLNSSIYYWI
jgi:hypothetical protein